MAKLKDPKVLMTLALVVAVLAPLLLHVKIALRITGFGRTYTNVNTTTCRQIGHGVLHGCEDIVVDPHTGLAYLACGSLNARQRWLTPGDAYDVSYESEADRVYVMREDDSYSEIRLLETDANGVLAEFSQSLRLHGFDVHWDPVDPQRMTFMFVNHQPGRPSVSIFKYTRDADHMVHVETVATELLHSPNNIVAMSSRAFYATNDIKYDRSIMRTISSNMRMPHGHIVYRNETGSFSIAAANIRYPNGIAKYQDQIYVASCSDPSVQIYRANADHTLEFQNRTYFPDSIPDNLFVDPQNGQIYATTFTKVSQTHKLFHNPSPETSRTAGTRVVRLTQRSEDQLFDIESLMVDSGELMPTATIAAIQRRNQVQRMLIGCVMCDFVVTCSV
ncbi:hypothetical protein IWW50_000538 [Coemansia erecta]|nr:hypothetical protein GGF43_000602 [Coemansia sp. RSA 2618]KAJ2829998.1 hypothetical protein IWW50_000538 [Coemansia erecta]